MDSSSLADNNKFLEILCFLEQLKVKKEIGQICQETDITEEILLEVIDFLETFGCFFKIEEKDSRLYLVPPEAITNIDFILKREGSSLTKQELFNKNETSVKDLKINIVEDSMNVGALLKIKTKETSTSILLPHRIVHLDGELSVIAEDTKDGCMIYFPILDLVEIEGIEQEDYSPRYTHMDVDDFIYGLRSVSGNEIRLVLKFSSHDHIICSPIYHFLGDPYITTNSEGETIWAATVEPCEDIYNWIAAEGDCVKILSPLSFKEEFCKFLEQKKAA